MTVAKFTLTPAMQLRHLQRAQTALGMVKEECDQKIAELTAFGGILDRCQEKLVQTRDFSRRCQEALDLDDLDEMERRRDVLAAELAAKLA